MLYGLYKQKRRKDKQAACNIDLPEISLNQKSP
jgi:hypothetical protein